jgi:DNA modification methylase
MTGRACSGIEIDPKYVDVIVRRWEDVSGRRAVLEGTGRTFEQIKAERLGVAA